MKKELTVLTYPIENILETKAPKSSKQTRKAAANKISEMNSNTSPEEIYMFLKPGRLLVDDRTLWEMAEEIAEVLKKHQQLDQDRVIVCYAAAG